MIVSPAIDIREGNCVQLVGGSYEEELFRLPDPISVCKDWISKGFSNVHIIDLDRATNRGSNVEVIEKLCATNSEINFRVGGGIRSTQDVRELLDFGSKSVVVGAKAVVDPKCFRMDRECASFTRRVNRRIQRLRPCGCFCYSYS